MWRKGKGWEQGCFVEAGMPSAGCCYISEEFRSRAIKEKFHLEPVLSNMSNSSIPKVCALFLLWRMKKDSMFEGMRMKWIGKLNAREHIQWTIDTLNKKDIYIYDKT